MSVKNMGIISSIFGNQSSIELKKINPILIKVNSFADKMRSLSDGELSSKTEEFKKRLSAGESLDSILPEAFAAIREADFRVLGLYPYDVQILGGIVLHKSSIAEMKTGEGKTLVETLPVYLNALTGNGVHVITVNNYLAKRDSALMGSVYRFMKLSVGLIDSGMTPQAKKAAYACDVTYGTNNEFGFDYLRDNMVTNINNKVQRGFNYAIIDEVDSILIDEARTPLIISGALNKQTDMYSVCDKIVKSLKKSVIVTLDSKLDSDAQVDGDYIVDEKKRSAKLTASGMKKVERALGIKNLSDESNIELAHHIDIAMQANGIMKSEVNYLVKDDEVLIVDEFTGRIMPGRRFNSGLHQAIEAKEGVVIKEESQTLASITFQNFFRMYNKLAGMTGTAKTEETEFLETYGLRVVEIPTNKPICRLDHNDRVYINVKEKYNAVVNLVDECHKKGQPVLIGTVSVDKSEIISKMLSSRGIKHNVLNAKNHEMEAEIISRAGVYGAVTVATNMAGRGTDIVLGGNIVQIAKDKMKKDGVIKEIFEENNVEYNESVENMILNSIDGHMQNELMSVVRAKYEETYDLLKQSIEENNCKVIESGGLCVIGTERHESRRIDNQLRGRSGRQGDIGESVFFLSFEDDLMRIFGGEKMQMIAGSFDIKKSDEISLPILTSSIESAQKKIEGINYSTRKSVLQYDDVINKQRNVIYKQRDIVLSGTDVHNEINKMIEDVIYYYADKYLRPGFSGDDMISFINHFAGWAWSSAPINSNDILVKSLDRDKAIKNLIDDVSISMMSLTSKIGVDIERTIERDILLRMVDKNWKSHIDKMDKLKTSSSLIGYGQRDPVTEYKDKGHDLFDEMIFAIKEDVLRCITTAKIKEAKKEN